MNYTHTCVKWTVDRKDLTGPDKNVLTKKVVTTDLPRMHDVVNIDDVPFSVVLVVHYAEDARSGEVPAPSTLRVRPSKDLGPGKLMKLVTYLLENGWEWSE